MNDTRESLRERVAQLVEGEGFPATERDALLRDLAVWQIANIPAWERLVRARGIDPNTASLDDIPAVPTDLFRYARIATFEPSLERRVFRTSGTTHGERGVHAFRDLSLYDRAARKAAHHALFPDRDRIDLLVFAPNEREAPESSLSYMLSRFEESFGDDVQWAWRRDGIDVDAVVSAAERAERSARPLALLGTSFAFVYAEDALGSRTFRLPVGSRIMQTGGFKGRTRIIPPPEMLERLTARYGVPPSRIVAEYGMTELTSQLYEDTLWATLVHPDSDRPRRLWAPPWIRVTPVDPETLRPVPAGKPGVLRIDDVANLDSACMIQTADVATVDDAGLVLHGRLPGAIPRGCSLAIEEALEAS